MDLKEIQNLIKFVAKSGASEVKLEMDDIKITIKTGSDSEIVHQIPVAAQMPQLRTDLDFDYGQIGILLGVFMIAGAFFLASSDISSTVPKSYLSICSSNILIVASISALAL